MIQETWTEVPSCHCMLLSSTEGEMSEGTGAQGTGGSFAFVHRISWNCPYPGSLSLMLFHSFHFVKYQMFLTATWCWFPSLSPVQQPSDWHCGLNTSHTQSLLFSLWWQTRKVISDLPSGRCYRWHTLLQERGKSRPWHYFKFLLSLCSCPLLPMCGQKGQMIFWASLQ